MRKLLLFTFILLTVVAWSKDEALNQMQSMTMENLANTTYYDEVHNSSASQNTSLKSQQNKFTTMRENAGYGFDTPADKKMTYHNGGSNKHVDGYVTNSEDGRTIIMESPTKNIPPVSKPVSISAEETDDMFLDMLGGTASANSYKGDYETAVGKKQEQNFDMSADLTQAAAKQNQADAQFANDVALAKQRQAQEEARRAAQAAQAAQQQNNSGKSGGSFLGNIGKALAQGAVNAYAIKNGLDPIDFSGNSNKNSGNSNQTCSYGGQTFRGKACDLCIYNKPRSSYACDQCCRSLGRPLMQAPSYSAVSSGGRPAGCLCRFGPTSGYRF